MSSDDKTGRPFGDRRFDAIIGSRLRRLWFSKMEELARRRGIDIVAAATSVKESLWQEAKRALKKRKASHSARRWACRWGAAFNKG